MKIIRTQINKPPRVVLYGIHGIGKSTFAAECPAPIFIQTEAGLDALQVQAFELAKSWNDVLSALLWLNNEPHEFKTVVIDSLDWAEKLLFESVAEANNVGGIEKIPFGRGYAEAETRWKQALDLLNKLNEEKKMLVVLLAHAQVKRFEDPERDSYDRYELDLQKRSAALVAEWCDILAFATLSTTTKAKDAGFGRTVVKASSNGDRIVYLEERPAHDAKNRYGLPSELPLSWDAIRDEIYSKQAERKATIGKANLKDVQSEKRVERLEKLAAQNADS